MKCNVPLPLLYLDLTVYVYGCVYRYVYVNKCEFVYENVHDNVYVYVYLFILITSVTLFYRSSGFTAHPTWHETSEPGTT